MMQRTAEDNTQAGRERGGVRGRERRAPKHSPVGRKRTRSGSKLPAANSRSGSVEGHGASGDLSSVEVLSVLCRCFAKGIAKTLVKKGCQKNEVRKLVFVGDDVGKSRAEGPQNM